jgi:small subunit ribosomal protein S9
VSATAKKTYIGTGRRKTSVARVRLSEGSGKISINGRDLDNYFTEVKDRNAVTGPLGLCEMKNKIDADIKVHGGGITGQAGAICQGVARAIKVMYGLDKPAAESADGDGANNLAKQIRDSGYLTRDGRMKERKKYGRKGARKSFQFSKR